LHQVFLTSTTDHRLIYPQKAITNNLIIIHLGLSSWNYQEE